MAEDRVVRWQSSGAVDDEELAATGAGTSVGHGDSAGGIVARPKRWQVLIWEGVAGAAETVDTDGDGDGAADAGSVQLRSCERKL